MSKSDKKLDKFHNIFLIIPAYNPDECLIDIVSELSKEQFQKIIVVDDGSKEESTYIFKQLEEVKDLKLITHVKNLGKGAALKSAFKEVLSLSNSADDKVITLDADGQHKTEDIIKIALESQQFSSGLIMGVRDFSDSVPFRSRFGNLLTRKVLKYLNKIDLEDSQTGLRAISLDLLPELLKLNSNRYEYELDCIIQVKRSGSPIIQAPIQTIYIDDNKLSHFRPVIDSMRIYFVFFRYLSVSVFSFLVDIVAFSIFYSLFSNIIFCTYLARFFSSIMNFFLNKKMVFKSTDSSTIRKQGVLYFGLVILIASLSGGLVGYVSSHSVWNVVWIKIFIDIHLFVFSFILQRYFIFKN